MKTAEIELKAPAKINLYLEVTGRRADGYHTIDSLMQKITLYDRIKIKKKTGGGISLRCPDSDLPENASNLVYQAAELFFEEVTRQQRAGSLSGIDISLHKIIPVGAGLGGGSSDAATALKGLNYLFNEPFSVSELMQFGLKIGADVPFFVLSAPACRATGIGELLEPVPVIEAWLYVIINPGFHVSTKRVYDTFSLTEKKEEGSLKNYCDQLRRFAWPDSIKGLSSLRIHIKNDLEKVTASMYPEIDQVKQECLEQGALAAMMSGSGPTVFAIFEDVAKAERCCRCWSKKYSASYVTSPVTCVQDTK
ncbi:MAG: 4-(cytidine 5'-diphospho)-2-C-methyl-D-erythritol kinase [Desulfobulbus propionicus]|nr:MAG: 4-(cytidine 5'-diphospho)-2-C-methyl-D-erythritol kinase [Desulfobulbus propionicus]